MWDIVKGLPLAFLLPVGLFLASVGPNDAKENIVKWVPWLRRQIMSTWIVQTLTFPGVAVGVLGIAVTYAFLVWGVPRLRLSTPIGSLIALIGMVVCGVSLASFTSIYVILSRSYLGNRVEPASSVSVSQGISGTDQAPSHKERTAADLDLEQYLHRKCFNYSTHDGIVIIQEGTKLFQLRFTKASNRQIYLYRDFTNMQAIARVRNTGRGKPIDFAKLDSTSRVYTISLGEQFLIKNDAGLFLQGKILSIKDDTGSDADDEVCFAYEFDQSGVGRFMSL